jgi:hypothetical protein
MTDSQWDLIEGLILWGAIALAMATVVVKWTIWG